MAPRHLVRLALGATRPASFLTLALLAGSCGGGGNPARVPVGLQAPAVAAESGIINPPETLGVNTFVFVGDNGVNEPIRGTLAFDITGVPAGATIVSATLRLNQSAVTNNPYSLGAVTVDHISARSYSGNTLTANVGTLSTSATVETKSLDVTAQVAADLAASRARSNFRLQFPTATNSNGTQDAAWFDSNLAGPPQVALIEISYLP